MTLLHRYYCWESGIDREMPVDPLALRRVRKSVMKNPEFRRRFNRRVLPIALPFSIIFVLAMESTKSIGLWPLELTYVALVACTGILVALCYKWFYSPHVRRELRRNGYDICVECGYWLRGLAADSAKCPECGAAIEQRGIQDNSGSP